MKLRKLMSSLLLTAAVLSACSQQQNTTAVSKSSETASENTTNTDSDGSQTSLAATADSETETTTLAEYYGSYDEDDLTYDYEADKAVTITLSETSQVAGSGATVSGDTVTITKAGTYVVKGTLSQGQLVVKAAKSALVRIILAGAEITNQNGPAIEIQQADKVVTTLAAGTENKLSDGTDYQLASGETEPDAAFYSKADLTINGSGTLKINGNYNNGIRGKDDLVLVSGTYEITAKNNGIKGKDSVSIRGGSYKITTAEGDGIQANNAEDTEKGWVAIDGGSYEITSGRDGIQAETSLKLQNSQLTIQTAAGADSSGLDASESYKGLKAGTELLVTSGTLAVNSADDSLHANQTVTIDGGTLQLASGDDGIHADEKLTVNDGKITVSQSYEGLEAAELYFNGGTVAVTATDDGINAGGGSDTDQTSGNFGADSFGGGPGGGDQADDSKFIEINGGMIAVDAEGDGVDSNGNITMKAGTLLINGPTNGGNGALDYNGSFVLSGGILMAAGSSGMAQNVSDTSTQTAVGITFDTPQAADTVISLTDQSGELLAAFRSAKTFQNLVISTPDLKQGETVVLASGGTAAGLTAFGNSTDETTVAEAAELGQLTLSDTVNNLSQSGAAVSSGAGMGGGPGGGMR